MTDSGVSHDVYLKALLASSSSRVPSQNRYDGHDTPIAQLIVSIKKNSNTRQAGTRIDIIHETGVPSYTYASSQTEKQYIQQNFE